MTPDQKVEAFLGRLRRVRATGRGSWIACCPAHDDQHPSMAITINSDAADGRILVKCFAGCSIEQILDAVAMDIADLCPDRLIENARSLRRPYPAADVLECLEHPLFVVALKAIDLAKGIPLSTADHDSLMQAIEQITTARSLALGEHFDHRRLRRA